MLAEREGEAEKEAAHVQVELAGEAEKEGAHVLVELAGEVDEAEKVYFDEPS